MSEIPLESLSSIPATVSVDAHEREVIERILFRLGRLEPAFLARANVPADPRALIQDEEALRGEIVEVRGRVVELDRLPPGGSGAQEASPIRCVMQLDTPDGLELAAVIWTNHVPPAWLEEHVTKGRVLNERGAIRGVLAGVRTTGGAARPIVLADRVAWHPDPLGNLDVPPGHLLLGAHGVDVGRLAEVRHANHLTRLDRDPFYQLLTAVEKIGQPAMIDTARESLAGYRNRWREESRTASGERAILAQIAQDAAAEGRYSVAPLFLDAEEQVGRLVLLEGIARRAIRIEVADSPAGSANAASPADIGHYYELEIFTSDSQNLPVVCCVPSLPAGFPEGDAIHARVRVAGFFFKLWRYDSRSPRGDAEEGPLRFQPSAAPLLVAAEPVRLATDGHHASGTLGWIIGGTFMGVLALTWWLVWTWSRGDRRFRRTGVR